MPWTTVRLVDVNVLVHAHREEMPEHGRYREVVERMLAGPSAYGMSDLVLSGALRVLTHPRVFDPPTDVATALRFVAEVRDRPNRVAVAPGPRHWQLFTGLVREVGARGNLVPDAWLAALAIEVDAEWLSADRDYARFPGLRWRHPLDS